MNPEDFPGVDPSILTNIKFLRVTCSAGDADQALRSGAVLLGVTPNPSASEECEAFCLLLGVEGGIEGKADPEWLKHYFSA
jgi:hypothetical protein